MTHRYPNRSIALILAFFAVPALAGAQWINVYRTPIHGLSAQGRRVFASNHTSGVVMSSDHGWRWSDAGLQNQSVVFLASTDSILFAGVNTLGGGIFTSPDSGATWTYSNLYNRYFSSFAVHGGLLFTATSMGHDSLGFYPQGLFASSDNGASWHLISGDRRVVVVYQLVNKGSSIFAAGDLGVSKSVDNGMTWSPANIGLLDTNVTSLALLGDTLIAGTYSGRIFRYFDDGPYWSAVGEGPLGGPITSLATIGTSIFVAVNLGFFNPGVLYCSTDIGSTWTDTDLHEQQLNMIAVTDEHLFASTVTGLWRRSLADLITSAVHLEAESPSGIDLCPNYPNPFNPRTLIKYRIPTEALVNLSVYDVLGRHLMTLVNELKGPGSYWVSFDASHMITGVYFYRLQVGKSAMTRSCHVLR